MIGLKRLKEHYGRNEEGLRTHVKVLLLSFFEELGLDVTDPLEVLPTDEGFLLRGRLEVVVDPHLKSVKRKGIVTSGEIWFFDGKSVEEKEEVRRLLSLLSR